MNWKETIKTQRANYSKKHLRNYSFLEKVEIIFLTSAISFKAFIFACIAVASNVPTPKNSYEDEASIFKAWYCYVFAKELLKY